MSFIITYKTIRFIKFSNYYGKYILLKGSLALSLANVLIILYMSS